MIKLSDVSVEELRLNRYDPERYEIIKSMGISNIQGLIDAIKQHPEIDWTVSKECIRAVSNIVNSKNKIGKEPMISNVREYTDQSLNEDDKKNNGDKLILFPPTANAPVTNSTLRESSISQIKEDIALATAMGDNYLISRMKNIGETFRPRIETALDFYTEQVERQAQQIQSQGVITPDMNIFEQSFNVKKDLINKKYPEIVEYLVQELEKKGLIWGDLSETQKKLLLNSTITDFSVFRKVRENLVQDVAYYTTVEEAFDMQNNDYEALNRFARK